MVVVLLHTPVAVAAVLGAHRTHCLAGVADVEDGVVVVPVVTPRGGVAYLYHEGGREGGREGGMGVGGWERGR